MATSSVLFTVLAVVAFADVRAQIPPRGNVGAWVYDHPEAEPPAQWSSHIKQFNMEAAAAGTGGKIDHVVLYGSDMEIYPDIFCCHPKSPTQTGRRLEMYGSEPNTTLTFIVDGRMNGPQEWAPDLSALSDEKIIDWSRWVAQWVCAYEQVDGIQLNLEPIAGPWNTKLKLMLKTLSSIMTSRDYGCTSPSHPQGRALSTFALVKDVDTDLLESLGPLGYIVVSGYDLGLDGTTAGAYTDPDFYEAKLRETIQEMSAKAAAFPGGMPYMVGVPAAASTFEFESFLYEGELIESGHSQLDYVTKALKVLNEFVADPNYLGPMLWTLSFTNVYPPQSQNIMKPTSAYANTDVWQYLQKNLDIAIP